MKVNLVYQLLRRMTAVDASVARVTESVDGPMTRTSSATVAGRRTN